MLTQSSIVQGIPGSLFLQLEIIFYIEDIQAPTDMILGRKDHVGACISSTIGKYYIQAGEIHKIQVFLVL